jgi:hypothetical protein
MNNRPLLRDYPGFDGQLVRGSVKGFNRYISGNTADFKQDSSRLDDSDIKLGISFPAAHSRLQRLFGHWLVGKDSNVNSRSPADIVGDCYTRSLYLPVSNPAGF